MIKYNELRLEGNTLHYNIAVEDLSYYEDKIYLEGFYVDTPDTYPAADEQSHYDKVECSEQTEMDGELVLPSGKDIYIITPIVVGTEDLGPDTPCGKDVIETAIVYDENIILDKGLNYLSTLADSCIIPKGFIDFILKKAALDLSIKACNYLQATKLWLKLTKYSINKTSTNGCGCHSN